MRCCHHPDRDAVAVCVNCRRALCPQCAFTIPDYRITCGECAEAVAASGSVDLSPGDKRRFIKGGIALVIVGCSLIVIGLLDRHFHWTDYANVWMSCSIAFFFASGYIPLIIVLNKCEAWLTARNRTRKGGRR